MIPAEIIIKKRDKAELSEEEISFFIDGLCSGAISEGQAGAFLMAAYLNGLSSKETALMTLAMKNSGKSYDFREYGRPVIDKHSTGGVGDKISLLLTPLAVSCGLAVPMISGRGLGHTGGTVDKLESIPGFNMQPDDEELHNLMRDNSSFMISQSLEIAPADRILYHLRDVTGTIESNGLIASSIISKKLAEGLDGLVLDIKTGKGAFFDTVDKALAFADIVENLCRHLDLKIRMVVSQMNQPLGYAVGNWIEVLEAENALKGDCPEDIRTVTVTLCANMLELAFPEMTRQEALNLINSKWHNGDALNAFYEMVRAQNGDLEQAKKLYKDTAGQDILAEENGRIISIDAKKIGMAGICLGAGRLKQDDKIDYGSGILLIKKEGEDVQQGDMIARAFSNNNASFPEAVKRIKDAYHISDTEPYESGEIIIKEIVV